MLDGNNNSFESRLVKLGLLNFVLIILVLTTTFFVFNSIYYMVDFFRFEGSGMYAFLLMLFFEYFRFKILAEIERLKFQLKVVKRFHNNNNIYYTDGKDEIKINKNDGWVLNNGRFKNEGHLYLLKEIENIEFRSYKNIQ